MLIFNLYITLKVYTVLKWEIGRKKKDLENVKDVKKRFIKCKRRNKGKFTLKISRSQCNDFYF